MVDWLIRKVRTRIAAIDRVEAEARNGRAVVIREHCQIAGLEDMAEDFIRSDLTARGVLRVLADSTRSRPC